jgi:hypothetical protein
MSAATTSEEMTAGVFASAAEKAAEMGAYLASKEALRSRHAEVEEYAQREGREWIRRMLQGHYDLRGAVEQVYALHEPRSSAHPSEAPGCGA